MDQNDLQQVSMLTNELRQITQAIEVFNEGGRIVNLTVASKMNEPMARSVFVQTATMAYPQQMVEAIKVYLSDREQELSNELAGLGVTGVDAGRR